MEGSCPVCRSHRSRSPCRELTYVVHACVRACVSVGVRMCSQNSQNWKNKTDKTDEAALL